MRMQADWGAGQKSTADLIHLDTPAVVVDLAVVERNIRRVQSICDKAGIKNRPHIKTHKSVELAQLQLKYGAAGITCQKLGEAEVMAAAGIDDILISYNVLGAAKHARLADLHRRISLTVCCDNTIVAKHLSGAVSATGKPLNVLVECDTGRHRCGVLSPQAAASLAVGIDRLPGLHFSGLLLYPPNDAWREATEFVAKTRQLCSEAGLDIATVSAGGTPNLACAGRFSETEFRSGTSIFNDRQMLGLDAAEPADCALFVHATVISHPEEGRIMLDSGSKTLTSDLAGFDDYGLLVDYPAARLMRFAEEHGFVDVSDCRTVPKIGEIVRILPNHVCPVVNLFDQVKLADGTANGRMLRIDARGRVN